MKLPVFLKQIISWLLVYFRFPSISTMYNYSNATQFGMKSDVERYFYISWLMFVVVCSLLGDTIILIASSKYNAFKLHKIIVALIQHLAVNDLLVSSANLAPAMFSAIYQTGSPYRFMDYIRFFAAYYSAVVCSVFISLLTTTKVLLLKYPFRVGFLSKRTAHKVCILIWILSSHVPLVHLYISTDDVKFDYRTYNCMYRYTSDIWKILLPAQAVYCLFIPNTIVVITTIVLMNTAIKAAKDHRKNLKWQGVTTVGLTAVIYTISVFPYVVYFIAEPFMTNDNPHNPGPFYVEFFRIANGVIPLSVVSNFFVYSLTVASFRRFLLGKLQRRDPTSRRGYYFTELVCQVDILAFLQDYPFFAK